MARDVPRLSAALSCLGRSESERRLSMQVDAVNFRCGRDGTVAVPIGSSGSFVNALAVSIGEGHQSPTYRLKPVHKPAMMEATMPPLDAKASGLSGLRIIVVEDEVAISLLLEDMLLDLGCQVIGPVGRVSEALALAEGEAADLAILDVNLGGEPIYPVAAVLARRTIPFAFSTGYGAGGIDEPYRDRPVLQKPFAQSDLTKILLATAGRG